MPDIRINLDEDFALQFGTYNIENIPYIFFYGQADCDGIILYNGYNQDVTAEELKLKIEKFIKENPDFCYACSDGDTGFILATKPECYSPEQCPMLGNCLGGTFKVGNILFNIYE